LSICLIEVDLVTEKINYFNFVRSKDDVDFIIIFIRSIIYVFTIDTTYGDDSILYWVFFGLGYIELVIINIFRIYAINVIYKCL
jgi:hypothetical protein